MGAFAPWTRTVFGPELTPPSLWAQWIAALVLGFGLAWTTLDIHAVSLKLIVAVVALVETAALAWMLAWRGIIWPPFTALSAGMLALLFGFIYSLSRPGRRHRLIEEMLGDRISRSTFRKLLEGDEPFPFAGEEREASVVVCRFFNRRELAEALSAADCVTLSNAFCSTVSAALTEAGGVLVEGDGEHFHAVFGALLRDGAHPARACRAALALEPRLDAFRRECRERWNVDPDCRIAVDAGPVIAGVFGVPGSGGFGVVGEALDAARHLCQANLFYGTRLLAGSAAFLASHGGVEARPVDLIWNREIREEIYELLAVRGQLPPEALQRRDAFWIGVIHCRSQRWKEAAAVLEPLLNDPTGAEDPLVRFYLERVAPKSSRP